MKALLVAEKPSVMIDIKKAYEKIKDSYTYDITFTCAAGHLIGLSEPDKYREDWGRPYRKDVLPIIPESWKSEVINPKFFKQVTLLRENGTVNKKVTFKNGKKGNSTLKIAKTPEGTYRYMYVQKDKN